MEEKMRIIREKILEFYEVDIDEAEKEVSSQNYVFVFPNESRIIRVNAGNRKTRGETVSETLVADDLKAFSETICEPLPSKRNNIVEEFDIDGIDYIATMFRAAKGKFVSYEEISPLQIVAVGEFLGRIHAGVRNAAESGISFKRKTSEEIYNELLERSKDKLDSEVLKNIEDTFSQIEALEKDPRWYGITHGDFHMYNFFLDGNNVWAFDFQESHYDFFINDIASICHSWLLSGQAFKEGKSSYQALCEDILPYLRYGYELHLKLPEEQWELVDLFIKYCSSLIVMNTIDIGENAFFEDNISATKFFTFSLEYENVLEGFDTIFRASAIKIDIRNTENENSLLKEDSQKVGENETLSLVGRLDSENASALDEKVTKMAAAGCKQLIFDCTDLQYVSSAGLRVFLSAYKKYDEMMLININDNVREILELTGLLEDLTKENL